jgi:hypothetical protein
VLRSTDKTEAGCLSPNRSDAARRTILGIKNVDA